jgi:hypothetical protein
MSSLGSKSAHVTFGGNHTSGFQNLSIKTWNKDIFKPITTLWLTPYHPRLPSTIHCWFYIPTNSRQLLSQCRTVVRSRMHNAAIYLQYSVHRWLACRTTAKSSAGKRALCMDRFAALWRLPTFFKGTDKKFPSLGLSGVLFIQSEWGSISNDFVIHVSGFGGEDGVSYSLMWCP